MHHKTPDNPSQRSTVAAIKVSSKEPAAIEQGFNRLLASLGGIRNIVPADAQRVLIKPNLMTGEVWSTGITVHPYLIELLIQALRREGFKVIVGEGAGWGCKSQDSFNATGVAALCQRLQTPLIDFKRGQDIRVVVPDGLLLQEVTVDAIIPDCDFIVSLAKMKTHCETIVSLSLKNMKGLITKDTERLRFHLLDVNRCLIDLNKTFPPNLSIVEGIVALEGIGPLDPGQPKDLGILVGGLDPVAVDSICTIIMRMNPRDIRHIRLAAEAGLGTMHVDRIEVIGDPLEALIPESYTRPPDKIEDISPFDRISIVNGNPCSNCIASLASYLHGYIDTNAVYQAISDISILIGKKATPQGQGKEIAIGNCLRRYQGKLPYVPGCPPASDAYRELVEQGLQGKFPIATVNSECKLVDPNTGGTIHEV